MSYPGDDAADPQAGVIRVVNAGAMPAVATLGGGGLAAWLFKRRGLGGRAFRNVGLLDVPVPGRAGHTPIGPAQSSEGAEFDCGSTSAHYTGFLASIFRAWPGPEFQGGGWPLVTSFRCWGVVLGPGCRPGGRRFHCPVGFWVLVRVWAIRSGQGGQVVQAGQSGGDQPDVEGAAR